MALKGVDGIQLVREVRPFVVLVDLKMPGISGIEVLQKINEIDPAIVTIVITGYGTIDSAVESMKLGAFDFITKPFEPEKLIESVRRGIKLRHLRLESNARKEVQEEPFEQVVPSKQDVLLKGLSVLAESYSVGYERVDFLHELNRLEEDAKYHAKELGRVKKREKVILDITRELALADEIVKKHEFSKSALIQILLDTQETLHWLPRHVLKWISERLNVPLGEIYNIATFYEAFNLEPQGAHTIQVCMGTACHVRGAPDLLRKASAVLGIEENQTDEKHQFTLKTVHCLGCCALSPVIQVDGSYLSNPSLPQLKKTFNTLSEGGVPK
jgi:NADH-quinone oxidoreductase subunit E